MARNDGEEAYAEYVAVALPRLRRIAFLLCQDWHRADDLTQVALTRLYVHWHRVATVESLDAYVGTILLNAYLSEQRTFWWKRTHVRADPGEPAAADTKTAGDNTAQVGEALDLRVALHTLAPRRRAVVVLRYYCDFTVEQTAEILKCSPGTVKSQTSRALAQLRDVLDTDGSAEESSVPAPTAEIAPSHRVGPSMPRRTL